MKESILKRSVRHHSYGYTKTKEWRLKAVAKKYRAFRNELFKKYGGLENLPHINRHRFTLSKKWAEDGLCEKYGLQGRQWKVVVDEVFNTLSAKIEQIKKSVRIDIGKNKKFSDEEHHYLMYLLCFNELLYNICNGRSVTELYPV